MEGHIYRIIQQITTIGRDLDNHLVMRSSFVSRNHAEIRYEEGVYTIVDKKSTSGVYVNGGKIKTVELSSEDLIQLADATLMFVIDPEDLADKSRKDTEPLPNN